jgi:hypothetical protein
MTRRTLFKSMLVAIAIGTLPEFMRKTKIQPLIESKAPRMYMTMWNGVDRMVWYEIVRDPTHPESIFKPVEVETASFIRPQDYVVHANLHYNGLPSHSDVFGCNVFDENKTDNKV